MILDEYKKWIKAEIETAHAEFKRLEMHHDAIKAGVRCASLQNAYRQLLVLELAEKTATHPAYNHSAPTASWLKSITKL